MPTNRSFKPYKMLVRIFSLLSLILLISCAAKNNQPEGIRIVDLNGNPKPVKRIVPEGNAQILAQQGVDNFDPNITAEPPSNPVNADLSSNKATSNYQKPSSESPDPFATSGNANNENQEPATISYDMSAANDIAAPKNGAKNQETQNAPPNINTTFKFKNASSQSETKAENIEPLFTGSANKKFKLLVNKASAKESKLASSKSGIFVQIGSFSSLENANKALEQSKNIAAGSIESVDLGGKKSYRVFLGPSQSKKQANNILSKAKNSGYKDAFIVK